MARRMWLDIAGCHGGEGEGDSDFDGGGQIVDGHGRHSLFPPLGCLAYVFLVASREEDWRLISPYIYPCVIRGTVMPNPSRETNFSGTNGDREIFISLFRVVLR